MLLHKPTFESITPDFGNSFTYQRFDEHHINDNSLVALSPRD